MLEPGLGPYRRVPLHETVSIIIRRRSVNPVDIREVALRDLDLSSVREVLDLGCGFGFIEELLGDRVASRSHIVGIDNWATNEQPFLRRVAASGHTGEFVCQHLESSLPFADSHFGLVLSCFSLYFFVDLLPEIARVLAPGGVFVALTHRRGPVAGKLVEAGYEAAAENLRALVRAFSAENGAEILGRCFDDVKKIDYVNRLRFGPEHMDELTTYLRFKLPLLVPGAEPEEELPRRLSEYVGGLMERNGEVVLRKDDAVFHCRGPR